MDRDTKACSSRDSLVGAWLQVLQQEEYEFSDPVTQFLTCLYVDFDFEGAQQKLAECETVLENDFFLTALKVSSNRMDLLLACSFVMLYSPDIQLDARIDGANIAVMKQDSKCCQYQVCITLANASVRSAIECMTDARRGTEFDGR